MIISSPLSCDTEETSLPQAELPVAGIVDVPLCQRFDHVPKPWSLVDEFAEIWCRHVDQLQS